MAAVAVFEKKKALKVSIDDTVSLSCTLEAAQKSSDHMVYFIQIIHMHFHCIYHAWWIDMPLEWICTQALDIHTYINIHPIKSTCRNWSSNIKRKMKKWKNLQIVNKSVYFTLNCFHFNSATRMYTCIFMDAEPPEDFFVPWFIGYRTTIHWHKSVLSNITLLFLNNYGTCISNKLNIKWFHMNLSFKSQ